MMFNKEESNSKFAVRAVISSVLLVALIVGLIVFGNIMENRNYSTNYVNNDNSNSNSNNNSGGSINNSKTIKNGNVRINGNSSEQRINLLPGMQKFDIKIATGECEILTTDGDPYMTVKSTYDVDFTAEAHDDEYDIRFKPSSELDNWFVTHNNELYIKIYLPEDNLREVDIDVSAGEVFVTGVNAEKWDLNVSAGNLEIKDCGMREVESDVTAGNLFVKVPAEIEKIDADVTAGDSEICLPEDISGFRLTSKVSAGGIENLSGFNIRENGGFENSTSVHGDERCEIKLEVSAGSLTISDY